MKIIKTLFFQSLVLTLVLASFSVYAVDQSICNSGANVVLYNNGSLKACQLKNDYDANNIRCKNDGPVSFYDNGNLESCMLSMPATITENKCKQDGLISFYIDGKLKSCVKPDN
jgi:antitoxin component YwqK of YwqJK toxin-antitoxin module